MISIEGLQKSYSRDDKTLQVIRGIDLNVTSGEFVTIMGASGSGKSTLLNIVACLDRADAGQYLLNKKAVHTANDDQMAEIRAALIGIVFQSFNLLSRRDAISNVMLPLLYQGTPLAERRYRAMQALDRVGLVDWASHLPNQLSGGQQQRVAIARALVNRPRLLIADEPTGALDSRTGLQVMELFKELHNEGHTLLMVTHDASLASYGDRIVNMRDGRIVP